MRHDPAAHRYVWGHVLVLAKPFFASRVRWKAMAALGVIVALLATLNGLNVLNSYVGRNFMTAIADRMVERYVSFTLLYLAVFAASSVSGVLTQYVQDRLALLWRDWMTRHLVDRYAVGDTLRRVSARHEIDNPDQRIAEDVRTFTTSLVSYAVILANAILTTVAFAGVLGSITPMLLLVAVAYAALGTLLTIGLGRRLVTLDNMQLRKEADLRYGLIRLRDHSADASAERAASMRERRRLRARLRRVVHNTKAVIGVNRNVGLFTSGYNYLVPILPVLIVAPSYMRGEIEFGVVTQSAMAFAQLLGALSLFVTQFQSLSIFAAVVRRLGALWDQMDAPR